MEVAQQERSSNLEAGAAGAPAFSAVDILNRERAHMTGGKGKKARPERLQDDGLLATWDVGNSDDPAEPEPEPEPSPSLAIAPDGRSLHVDEGVEGKAVGGLEDLTRLDAGAVGERWVCVKRAAVSSGIDLLSHEKGHLNRGETFIALEFVVYAGRARVRFNPPAEGRPGGWASVRSGGGRALLRPEGAAADSAKAEAWMGSRERAAQVLAITHGLREELVPVVLESSAAEGGDDEEWHDRLLEMSAEEVKLLAAEAEQTLLLCATIDEKLEAASAALLSGEYEAAQRLYEEAVSASGAQSLARRGQERQATAQRGLEEAAKGLRLMQLGPEGVAHALMMDDTEAGAELGVGERGEHGFTAQQGLSAAGGAAAAQGHELPKAPLPPFSGPSRPAATMFSIYFMMPKKAAPPDRFEVTPPPPPSPRLPAEPADASLSPWSTCRYSTASGTAASGSSLRWTR